jgi:hypothetical protein
MSNSLPGKGITKRESGRIKEIVRLEIARDDNTGFKSFVSIQWMAFTALLLVIRG